jgi:hypothetical protein
MNIKIRTITLEGFLDNIDDKSLGRFVSYLSDFEKMGYPVRTYRLVTDLISSNNIKKTQKAISRYFDLSKKYNFWGTCFPFDLSGKDYHAILDLAKYTAQINDNIFINLIPVKEEVINLKSILEISEFIIENSTTPINNFRLGVSSSYIKSPFFPFSYAEKNNEFIVGLELVEYLTKLVKNNNRLDLESLRDLIMNSLMKELGNIQNICLEFEKKSGISYGGIDLSLAPYPYPLEDQSVVYLIEEIGQIARSRGESIFEFGASGTHFINTFLTNILKFIAESSKIKTTGFNGIMYSLLEDTYLSKRYGEKTFNLDFLKLLSTTCGCGVDMVPLCGDVKDSSISGIIMDVISTGIVLKKPLGIRLLPIPNSKDGERTNFKHLFFSNTKIREINDGMTLQYLPTQQEFFTIKKKKSND